MIKIIQGDITTLAVDAIVNAANQVMLGGGGVDGAIHRAAGHELYEACLKVPEVRPGVRCPTGEARITPGFKLPAKFVIHTVGPVYRDGQYVFVQKCETLSPGEVGVFFLDGRGYLKVYDEQVPDNGVIDNYIDSYGVLHKQPVLISYNTKDGQNPPRPVMQDQTFWIMGRVLN